MEFTTASLEPVLHHANLGKQVQRVTKSVSSLHVCQDRLQTQRTELEDGIESQLEGLDSTLKLNISRALESTPLNPYPRPLIYSPPLTSIPHLESVMKAPSSFFVVSISSISPEIGSSPTVSLGTRQTAPPNVIVSMFGSPASPFAYTIFPSHGPSLVPNSTNSTDALPHLGCNDLNKGVQSMGFSLTHSDANLQLMRIRSSLSLTLRKLDLRYLIP
ncbi:hypothetical protein D8674_011283 [Pyrus ussuriensis x Pyrus communis]|uniref:Uncharacterized protein n=1 Tax=Pyrus ussuriensis x Pyrus communis TaxID=2448454 RepID=A0A5N5FYA2_9ROSA|nr:hypothetical protein D8674_011283 [Pyrus ussuriensis x Pyrus communis]